MCYVLWIYPNLFIFTY